MIKWIGQHIFDLISRFRTTVYLENLETSTETNILVVDSDGKVTKNADAGDDMSFTVEDGDTTDVVISDGKHWKFVEGGNININWTDTDNGTSSDEYDLTFTGATLQELLISASHNIRGVAGSDVTIASAQDIKFHIDYDQSETAGTHTFDFVNGTGSVVASIDESGVPTFSIGAKGSASSAVLVDGGSGAIKSRTLAEFKGDASLGNVEDKSSATIRGEIVDGNIPALATGKITSGTFDDARIPSLAASKVTSGTFDAARIPTLNQDTTGSAAAATNLTASTSTAVGLGTIELGHASDTTIARSAAGKVTIESAPIQTTQMSVTNHAFALDSNNSAYNYFPLNNLNETRAGDTAQYYARLIAPYAGKVLRVVVRATADMGDCRIRLTKLSTSGQSVDGLRDEGTDVETTDVVDCSAINTTHTFNLTGAFAAGDVVNVGILKGSTNTAFVTAAVVWEYTV